MIELEEGRAARAVRRPVHSVTNIRSKEVVRLSFIAAIKTCFRKYAEFHGRASRPEFWWFVLFYYLLIFVAVVPLFAVSSDSMDGASFNEPTDAAVGAVFGVLIGVAFLALLI